MDSISDLTTAAEAVGAPKEFSAHINKIAVEVFAGVSGLDMQSLGAGDVTTISTVMTNAGAPAEAIAQLDKVKDLLTV